MSRFLYPSASPNLDREDQLLLDQVLAYYHVVLKRTPRALAFLARHGVTDPEVIAVFRLGFADRSLSQELPPLASADGEAVRGRLQRLRLLRASGHPQFRGAVVIPVLDREGRVVDVWGLPIDAEGWREWPCRLSLHAPPRRLTLLLPDLLCAAQPFTRPGSPPGG